MSGIKSPVYQAQAQWNGLPADMRWCIDKNEFKSKVKAGLFLYFHTLWRSDSLNLWFDGQSVLKTHTLHICKL